MLNVILAAAVSQAAGTWQGELKAGTFTLHVVLTVSAAGEAVMRVPEQGNVPLVVDKLEITGKQVAFTIARIGGSFEGELKGNAIAGTWRQGGSQMPLIFEKTDKPFSLARNQEPKPPYPYDEEEVSYGGPAGRITGTLTRPRGKGPFPVALLITGSGQQNRDEELFGHKPFKLIADTLTRRGVAVLRVDDRGVGGSEGDPRNATTADFAADVRAGVSYLRGRPDLDPARVGLIGHSEGGLIAPMVAADDPKLAFEVLLAGPGVSGDRVLIHQASLLMSRSGIPDAQLAENQHAQAEVLNLVRSVQDVEELKRRVRAVLLPLTRAEGTHHAQLTPAEVDRQAEVVASPWYRFFVTYDPAPVLARVKTPTLALNGSNDLQVAADDNLPAIAAAMRGNPDVTTRELPRLNHLFQTSQTGLPNEYATIEETMAPAALNLLAGWVVEHVKP